MQQMSNKPELIRLISSYKQNQYFDYNLAVDWAVQLIDSGIESESVYMLASFTKPVDSGEIAPYISAVLRELNISEKTGDEGILSKLSYYLSEIVCGRKTRMNLADVYRIALDRDCAFELEPFYMLYYAWDELDEIGANYYYEGATKENIESILKKEAKKWMDQHLIHLAQ